VIFRLDVRAAGTRGDVAEHVRLTLVRGSTVTQPDDARNGLRCADAYRIAVAVTVPENYSS
jgi:hypothetical protein